MKKSTSYAIVVLFLLIILFIIVCSILFLADIENDDDFAPYKHGSYDISVPISNDIFVIGQIEKQISDIALEYAENIKLRYVDYYFYSENKGEIIFFYSGEYVRNLSNYVIAVEVYIDFCEKKAYKVTYEDGISKRVVGYTNSELEIKSQNVLDKYLNSLKQSDINYDNLEYVKISYRNNDVNVYYSPNNNK